MVFDVGETLVDETLSWRALAAHAGVAEARVVEAVERAAAESIDHRVALAAAIGRPLVPGEFAYVPTRRDLYPDALPVLAELIEAGVAVGIVGNQPQHVESFLTSLGVRLAVVGSSQRWGVEKPDRRFFVRIAEELARSPHDIVYVGDRVDNDILPARAVGMRTVLVKRGPWGRRHATWPEAQLAGAVIGDLGGLLPAMRDRHD